MRPGELISLRRGGAALEVAGRCRPEILSKQDEKLLAEFARELPAAIGLAPSRVILVFDADRKAIYAGKSQSQSRACPQRATLANDRLRKLAAQSGMQVIDGYPVFQRHFAAGSGRLDRSPVDAHWNPAAHRLIAREIARLIER